MAERDDDISLFPILAKGRSRAAVEALLEKPRRQVDLAKDLGMTDQAAGQVVSELERAGIVIRDSPRGRLRIAHVKEIAELLVAESGLAEVIHTDKAKRATGRRRRLRKLAMQIDSPTGDKT